MSGRYSGLGDFEVWLGIQGHVRVTRRGWRWWGWKPQPPGDLILCAPSAGRVCGGDDVGGAGCEGQRRAGEQGARPCSVLGVGAESLALRNLGGVRGTEAPQGRQPFRPARAALDSG